jgi:dolichyl-phosphate beta-glucosyltransferase
MLSIPTTEVPIGWEEIAGSKISLVWDSAEMLKDLCVLRANYAIGRWKVKTKSE